MTMDTISRNEAEEILTADINTSLDLIKQINIQKSNNQITYSKNVFIPLTEICRNDCGYCNFKKDSNDTVHLNKMWKMQNIL